MSVPLVFKVDKMKRHYVTREWVSNGHWAIKREVLVVDKKNPLRKPLMALATLTDGKHEFGELCVGEAVPDINRFVPNLDGYEKAEITRDAKFGFACHGEPQIVYIILQSKSATAGIAPEYLPLLSLGDEILIKNKLLPIVVRKCGELVAVVMVVKI